MLGVVVHVCITYSTYIIYNSTIASVIATIKRKVNPNIYKTVFGATYIYIVNVVYAGYFPRMKLP